METECKTGIILQARMGSTRLPGKMIRPFYDGKGVLELLLKRLKDRFVHRPDVIMLVATTLNPSDDTIVAVSKRCDIPVFRGSEEDVLRRFIDATAYTGTDRLIRVCADNPFLDMEALDILLGRIRCQHHDYIAFATSDGIPSIKTHYGFWPEAVRSDALLRIAQATTEKLYHEHVTNYIYTHMDSFDIDFIPIPPEIEGNENIRLTLDTPEDFEIQHRIYAYCLERYGKIDIPSVLQTLDAFPGFYEQMKRQIQLNIK
jgi:Spore coat polysaccharide biosynthesis protein F, CMP-KDO synthetase homolog